MRGYRLHHVGSGQARQEVRFYYTGRRSQWKFPSQKGHGLLHVLKELWTEGSWSRSRQAGEEENKRDSRSSDVQDENKREAKVTPSLPGGTAELLRMPHRGWEGKGREEGAKPRTLPRLEK